MWSFKLVPAFRCWCQGLIGPSCIGVGVKAWLTLSYVGCCFSLRRCCPINERGSRNCGVVLPFTTVELCLGEELPQLPGIQGRSRPFNLRRFAVYQTLCCGLLRERPEASVSKLCLSIRTTSTSLQLCVYWGLRPRASHSEAPDKVCLTLDWERVLGQSLCYEEEHLSWWKSDLRKRVAGVIFATWKRRSGGLTGA